MRYTSTIRKMNTEINETFYAVNSIPAIKRPSSHNEKKDSA